jgi:hypothetical protein
MGVEMTLTKRLSNKWMMNAALNYSDHRQYFDSPVAYQDPTNIDFTHGEQMAYESGGSGKVDIWANTRWQVKVNGMNQLPWGINFSGFMTVREGYVLPLRLETPTKSDGTGKLPTPYVVPFGSKRLPTFWMADLRIEKVLPIGDYGSVSIIGDIFNLFNNNSVLGRETILNYATAYQPLEIINPRVFRLGVRFRF